MRTMLSSRDVGKWSVVAVKAAVAVLAALPRVKEALGNKAGSLTAKSVNPLPSGQFGLLLLDDSGNLIVAKEFSRHEVSAGFVDTGIVQQSALSVGAHAAVMTYKSQTCLVDNPSTYRKVVRQVFTALADINVKLLNRTLVNTDE